MVGKFMPQPTKQLTLAVELAGTLDIAEDETIPGAEQQTRDTPLFSPP